MARDDGEPRAVRAAPPIEWVVRVPGSKSLTNRALVLAAMAGGVTEIELALRSADTDALALALTSLGAEVESVAPSYEPPLRWGGFRVTGVGGEFPRARRSPSTSVTAGRRPGSCSRRPRSRDGE